MTRTHTDPRQMELLLPELCFPGRQTVLAHEVAAKCGISERQVHLLLEDPESGLVGLDIGRAKRGAYRIPVTSYYSWLAKIATGIPSENPILSLDTQTLISLYKQIHTRLEIRGINPFTIKH